MYTIYGTDCKEAGNNIEANEANEREPNKPMRLRNTKAHLEEGRWPGENVRSAPYARQ